MAKQRGIIKIEGTIGDITFVKTKDGYIAREKTSMSASRIASDPAFARTRENMAEFGRAGKAGKLLRNAGRTLLQNAKDSKVISRLTKEMMRVLRADSTSTRGQRNIIDGETELLEGFDFNNDAKLSATIFAPYTSDIDRVSGQLTVSIPPFIPLERITAPAGASHYKISTLGAEINFEGENYVIDSHETPVLPLNGTMTQNVTMQNGVTANSTHPLFLFLSIQFFQEVNGIQYPLNNGAFNALNLVKVSGV